ncbi:MAG: hypothetical protein PUP92_16365 [Rhizonema sp. PD38]|nr:hypothetical protein [Rhizonema sp. PD38]
MNQPLKIKNHFRKKLEIGITFLLFFYYLRLNLPSPVVNAWALFGFITVSLLVIGHYKRFFWVATRDLVLLLLTASALISFLWSTNPESTLAYCRALFCSTAFGVYLATCYTLKEQMRLLVWILGIFTCLNFIVPLILPSYAIEFDYAKGPAWQGLTSHKNELSGSMNVVANFFLTIGIYDYKSRWIALTVAGLALVILVLSKGQGNLGTFVGLLPLLPLYKIAKQEYRVRTILGICAVVIVGVITIATLVELQFIVVDLLGKDLGGNGRDQVWDYLIQRGLEKPWLGYGYSGFWNDPTEGLGVALKFSWIGGAGQGGGNAHSSYVDLFLHLGWLGVSLTAFSFLNVLSRVVLLIGLTKQLEYFWMLQFLLFLAINSSYESYGGFLAYRHWFWVLYVSYACSTAIHLNRIFQSGNKLANLQAEKNY